MDGEIEIDEEVFIVGADEETKLFFQEEIANHNYPIKFIPIEEALAELEKIEEELSTVQPNQF